MLCCVFCSLPGYSQTTALFIGNSYTSSNNLPQLIQDIATSKGQQFLYDTSTPGGYRWDFHVTNPTSMGKIDAGNYDYLVLQEQSLQLARNEHGYAKHQHHSFPYADLLDHRSALIDSCHKTMLYLTWGRENGNSIYQSGGYGQEFDDMQDYLTENYLQLASLIDAEVAPVGEAWREVIQNHPQINLFTGDGSHPSLAGSYLAACVFYIAFFHEPVSGAWSPPGLSTSTAQQLQLVADQTVVGSWIDWNIDPQPLPCSPAGTQTNNHLWESIDLNTSSDLVDIRFTSDQNGYVKGGGTKVWATEDGGDSWQPVNLPAANATGSFDPNSYSIFYLNQDTAWFTTGGDTIDSASIISVPFGGDTGDFHSFLTVYQTTDGGDSWQDISPSQVSFGIANGGLLQTRPSFTNLNMIFEDDQKGTIIANYGDLNDTAIYTFYTDDGGLSWHQEIDTLETPSTPKVWYRNTHEAFKSGHKTNLHQNTDPQIIYKTTDRGATWNPAATIHNHCCEVPFSSVFHHFSTLHLEGADTLITVNSFSNPTVYRSANAGQSWDSIASLNFIGGAKDVIQVPGQDYYLTMSGQVNRVLVSHDQGLTWQVDAFFPQHPNAQTLTNDHLYVAGGNGSIHRKPIYWVNSVEVKEPQPGLAIFPNPSRGILNLKNASTSSTIEVYSMAGRLITKSQTNLRGKGQMNLSTLSPGMYLIRVVGPDSVQSRKWILEH